jgi:hypothetical protein
VLSDKRFLECRPSFYPVSYKLAHPLVEGASALKCELRIILGFDVTF